MFRLGWLPLLLVAACVSQKDDRPLELDYLTQNIFSPTCGATQCHSNFRQQSGLAFSTPETARATLVDFGLVTFNSTKFDPADAKNADLIIWITETYPFGGDIPRMPLDAPMPNRDVLLLEEWIEAGAPGAQCNPDEFEGKACNDKEVVECTADWNFGTRVQLCTGGCVNGKCV